MTIPARTPLKPRPSAPPEPPAPRQGAPGEYDFSDDHKNRFRSLAASLSFVGVSTMLFGVMAGLFSVGAVYAGYAANGVALFVLSGVFVATAWWTVSAARALSSMVATRGRDIDRLMQTVDQLRRLFGFTRAFIIVVAVGLVGVAGLIVWCTTLADKGGRCLFW